ncbi:SacI homology domain-containing protein [Phakopsora pachyrhizi]|nr:SacI homology domain-containing protein [Phakopsora pachyrhizi]
MESVHSFSLPRNLTIYVSNQALYIKPGGRERPEEIESLVRLEWCNGICLSVVSDRSTILELLSVPSILSAEFDGLVGLIGLFNDCYLVLISSCSVVGSFDGREIYSIDQVLSLPLSYSRAVELIKEENLGRIKANRDSSQDSRVRRTISNNNSESEDDSNRCLMETDDDLCVADSKHEVDQEVPVTSSTKAKNYQKLGMRLSRLIWSPKPLVTINQSNQQLLTNAQSTIPDDIHDDKAGRLGLDKRFIRELNHELSNGGMYFALDWDITHTFQSNFGNSLEKPLKPTQSDQKHHLSTTSPLHRRAKRKFWWNRLMILPFIKSGFDKLGYVVMQGFVESKVTSITSLVPAPDNQQDEDQEGMVNLRTKPTSISIGLISRRSILRPGLRYQRRGIDSKGSVANFVETEFILETQRNPYIEDDRVTVEVSKPKIFWSFVQIRGSIPLFWSQSAMAIKPPIISEGTSNENLVAVEKHFSSIRTDYGEVLIINLAEKGGGNESKIVEEYEAMVKRLNENLRVAEGGHSEKEMEYVGWDFHQECKGMHYENVSNLIDLITVKLEQFGYFSIGEDEIKIQRGVIRSNCIDCLDRTNVIQSSIAKNLLNKFLSSLDPELLNESSNCRVELDRVFNIIWANNGDSISRQYAGTSALKGDFVRTGKRNWRGLLNDATNSLARIWQNSMLDFFKQSVIDYVLGVNVPDFKQFKENYYKVNVIDPGEQIRLSKIRSNAINEIEREVLSEGERKVRGFSILYSKLSSTDSKDNSNDYAAGDREAALLILSDRAIYLVDYCYRSEKIHDVLRIDLKDIVSIQQGLYVNSVAEDSDRDMKENYGFIVLYDTKANYSGLQSSLNDVLKVERSDETCQNDDSDKTFSKEKTLESIVFKAIKNQIVYIDEKESRVRVRSKDIISIEEAEIQSGLFARVTRSVKQIIR